MAENSDHADRRGTGGGDGRAGGDSRLPRGRATGKRNRSSACGRSPLGQDVEALQIGPSWEQPVPHRYLQVPRAGGNSSQSPGVWATIMRDETIGLAPGRRNATGAGEIAGVRTAGPHCCENRSLPPSEATGHFHSWVVPRRGMSNSGNPSTAGLRNLAHTRSRAIQRRAGMALTSQGARSARP